MNLQDIEQVLIQYYSIETSQEDKRVAQDILQDYLDNCSHKWEDIMLIMKDLTIDSLENCMASENATLNLIRLQWPLKALTYIICNNWKQIENPDQFYRYLFDLYTEKIEIIQKETIFFNQFVQVFTNLALNDKAPEGYKRTLDWYEKMFDTFQGDLIITHSLFISKYFKYLYEDAFENLEYTKLSYTKEIIMKRDYAQKFIERLHHIIREYSDLKSDDIMTGINCLYIFRSERIEKNEAELFWDLSKYNNLICFLTWVSKIVSYSWVDDHFCRLVCERFYEISKSNVDSDTTDFLTMSIHDLIKWSFDLDGVTEELQRQILDFSIELLREMSGHYKSWMHLFEGIAEYIRMSHFGGYYDPKDPTDLINTLIDLCVTKVIYPEFFDIETLMPQKRKHERSKYKSRYSSTKEDESDDDDGLVIDMSNEQSAFVHMRHAVSMLILEIWLKVKSLDNILLKVISIGTHILKNEDNAPTEELEFRIESILMVLRIFTDGIKRGEKINDYGAVSDKFYEFLIEDGMRQIFAGPQTHWLVTKAYLDCLVNLKRFFRGDEDKEKLWYLLLEIMFQDHILLTKEAGLLSYYIKSFLEFIQGSIYRIREEEWLKIAEDLKTTMIPTLTSGEAVYSQKTSSLFEVLGYVTQNPERSLQARVEATMDALNFIKSMFENAKSLEHFKLWQKCTLSFLGRMKIPIEPEIGWLFFYIVEMFVLKVWPNHNIASIDVNSIWDVKVPHSNISEHQWMIQLRKLVQEVYMSLAPKIDPKNRLKLFKISMPILVSCLNNPQDSFTMEPAKKKDLQKTVLALTEATRLYWVEAIDLNKIISFRLLFMMESLYKEWKEENYHPLSDSYREIVDIINYYLIYMQKMIQYDSHCILIGEEGNELALELFKFLDYIISDPVDFTCTETAVEIVTFIVKDFTNYKDEAYCHTKEEIAGEYIDKSIIGISQFAKVGIELEKFTSVIIKDHMFSLDVIDKTNQVKGILTNIIELFYVRAKLDVGILEDCRKYWKSKDIDYRWVLELKAALEEVLKDTYRYNVYWMKNDVCKKYLSTLQDWSIKRMLQQSEQNQEEMC